MSTDDDFEIYYVDSTTPEGQATLANIAESLRPRSVVPAQAAMCDACHKPVGDTAWQVGPELMCDECKRLDQGEDC